jgi:C4-dicarboxylate-specific signal transduction histidine kinase
LLTARAGERERLEALADSLDNNVNSSLSRITELVGHMQRFTNLDRAEERHFDVKDMIGDVIELMEPGEKSRVQLDVSSNHLPRVYSRPQQVGAVLSRLISESIQAAPDPTPVRIAVASEDGAVKIVITDQRPSLAPDELRRLFEPNFRVRRGRMAAANWSWFHSREMLRELGGDLAVSSSERTATILSLPVEKPDESASDRNGRDSPTSL